MKGMKEPIQSRERPNRPPRYSTIDRGHVSFGRSIIRKLAVKRPEETLLYVDGKPLAGQELVDYLDAMPPGRVFLSDCPRRKPDGACGCFE